jgi:hypothetical protein
MVGNTVAIPCRPRSGSKSTTNDGKLPGKRVTAVTWPSWKGTSGSNTAEAANDMTEERRVPCSRERPAHKAPTT